MRPARVVVLGGAGAGKSTLARTLGEGLGAPVVHLDRLVFGPGWSRTEPAAVRAQVAQIASGARWVVEGTYPDLWDLLLPRADLVVWIDQPAWLRLFRAWRKTWLHRGQPRADRPDDCAEGFTLAYARTVARFGTWTPAVEAAIRSRARDAEIFCAKGDRGAARLTDQLWRTPGFDPAEGAA